MENKLLNTHAGIDQLSDEMQQDTQPAADRKCRVLTPDQLVWSHSGLTSVVFDPTRFKVFRRSI